MDVQPIHPKVVAATVRMLRENQGESDEWPTVVRPRRQRWQPFEMDVVGDDLSNRASVALLSSSLSSPVERSCCMIVINELK